MYKILVEQRVYKDFDRISVKDLNRIYAGITALQNNPRQSGSKKLKGYANRYRLRQGDYRIVYTIDDEAKVVSVFLVRHRKDVYRQLD